MKAKIRICDAMMGSGKTSAAIKYMNECTDRRFLFITPYLDECDRIKRLCKARNFLAPWRSEKSKFEKLHELLAEKHNLASTHAMMHKFNEQTIQLIREGHYTLVLDEVFDVLNVTEISKGDIAMLVNTGEITIESDGAVVWSDKEYGGTCFADFKKMCDDDLVVASDDDVLVWQFPTAVFDAFDEVIILTYQFDSQIQRAYFDINGLQYEYVGVHQNEAGQYEFCPLEMQEPERRDYASMIHIIDSYKLNRPGNSKTALSISWSQREMRNDGLLIRQLKKNVDNIRRHVWKPSADSILWTCAKENIGVFESDRLDDDKYLAWNYRATNAYRTKRHLFYLHNVFLNPNILQYLHQRGADIQDSQYALTSLIQWIWRSAIRDGHEIWVYIPSARMRGLLKDWLGIALDDIERDAVYGKAAA